MALLPVVITLICSQTLRASPKIPVGVRDGNFHHDVWAGTRNRSGAEWVPSHHGGSHRSAARSAKLEGMGHRLMRRDLRAGANESQMLSLEPAGLSLPRKPRSERPGIWSKAAFSERTREFHGQVSLPREWAVHHKFKWYWSHDSKSMWSFLAFALLLPALLVPLARWRGAAWRSIGAVILYFVINPLMLLCNKVAIMVLPAPGLLLCMQFGFATVVLWIMSFTAKSCCPRSVIQVEPLGLSKMWRFGIVALSLLLQVFANLQSMRDLPIETMLCMRSVLPLILIVPDYFLFGMALPSCSSLCCLCGMATCMCAYAWRELWNVTPTAAMWMGTWMGLLLFDAMTVKHVMETVPMNTWTRCYYTNALGLGPLLLANLTDLSDAQALLASLAGWDWLVVGTSCVLGVMVCYAAYLVREVFSTSAAAVVTTACKWLAILVNTMMWDQHTSTGSALFVLASLACSAAYMPPGRRKDEVQAWSLSKRCTSSASPSRAAAAQETPREAAIEQAAERSERPL
mmetsp:Transcript_142297/g.258637  ORF Transcript_142297/g.258637 Transcript_142297/m.258637 type:complete len:515 (+) Transcript_142297:145-1689(+)